MRHPGKQRGHATGGYRGRHRPSRFAWGWALAVLLLCSRASPGDQAFPWVLQWKRLTRTPVTALVWSDSMVYAGTEAGEVIALRSADGTGVWRQRGRGPLRRSLALAGGRLLLADGWGQVEALDRRTGATAWRTVLQGRGECRITVQDSLLFVGSADGWLYALGVTDGAERWRLRTGLAAPSTSWVSGERLYTGACPGSLTEVEARTGQRLRRVPTEAQAVVGPVAVDNQLVVGCSDGYLRAYRRRDLLLRWSTRLGAVLQATPLAVGDDRLICLAANGWLYGVETDRGRLVWKHSLQVAATGPPVLDRQGRVLVPTAPGRVIALDPDQGRVLWDLPVLAGVGFSLQVIGSELLASVGDGYLYAFGPPPEPAAAAGARWEGWWELLDHGRKTGYAHQVWRGERLGGRDAWRLFEEQVSWTGGWVRQEEETWVDQAFRPLAYTARRSEGDQEQVVRATWTGRRVVIEERLDQRRRRRQAEADSAVTLTGMPVFELAVEGRVRSGSRDSVRVCSPVSLAKGMVYASFEPGDSAQGAVKARMTTSPTGDDPLEEVIWLDAEGFPVRQQVPLLASDRVRVDPGQALAWEPPGPGKAVQLDYPVEEPAKLERLVLQLPSRLAASLVTLDERQQLEEPEEAQGAEVDDPQHLYSGYRLVVVQQPDRASPSATEPSLDKAERSLYLRPSLYVESDDPRIQALAAQIAGSETDPLPAALRLQHWVHDRMKPAETEPRFQSAGEVVEDPEGTCSEYTTLLLALCRAAGIPARACSGFLVSPAGVLVPHLWVQVWAGGWRGLDATLDQDRLDAAHLQLGQGDLSPAGLGSLDGPVGLFLACVDTVRVVEYRAHGRSFTAAAERLWTAAEQAQSAGADTVAEGLYRQLLELSPHQRRDQAGLSLGRLVQQQGRVDEARALFTGLLDGEAAAEALFQLARIARQQGDAKGATRLLERLVDRYPDHALAEEALGILAETSQRTGGCPQALPWYERLLEEHAGSGWAVAAQAAVARCGEERTKSP